MILINNSVRYTTMHENIATLVSPLPKRARTMAVKNPAIAE